MVGLLSSLHNGAKNFGDLLFFSNPNREITGTTPRFGIDLIATESGSWRSIEARLGCHLGEDEDLDNGEFLGHA